MKATHLIFWPRYVECDRCEDYKSGNSDGNFQMLEKILYTTLYVFPEYGAKDDCRLYWCSD